MRDFENQSLVDMITQDKKLMTDICLESFWVKAGLAFVYEIGLAFGLLFAYFLNTY